MQAVDASESKLFYESYLFKLAVGGIETLDDRRVPQGQMRKITHLSIEDRANNFTYVRIATSDGNVDMIQEEEVTCLANNVYWTRSPIYVKEGHFIRFILSGCTATDQIHAFIQGVQYPAEERLG